MFSESGPFRATSELSFRITAGIHPICGVCDLGPFVNDCAAGKTLSSPDVEAASIEEIMVPHVGAGIHIDAREGVFVVLRTDVDRGTVDVLRVSGIRQIEGGVPLGSVRIVKGLNAIDQLRNLEG
jgi:hypothetical protein